MTQPSRLLIAGTVTLDTVDVGEARYPEVPGGSALYAAAAASRFGPCRVVGTAGSDLTERTLQALTERGVDCAGIVRRQGPTFRWHARYGSDLHGRETVERVVGVGLEPPRVPEHWRSEPSTLLLGSMDPAAQRAVLAQVEYPRLVGLDTMRHWIADRRKEVLELAERADVLFLSDEEAQLLAGTTTTEQALAYLSLSAPDVVVVKRGAQGAWVLWRKDWKRRKASAPTAGVVDPTGAGDAFAGAFMSALRHAGGIDEEALEVAIDAGVRTAALAIQAPSFDALMGE